MGGAVTLNTLPAAVRFATVVGLALGLLGLAILTLIRRRK